ncbi:ribosomal protein S18-alanine N-acetyltransferase [Halanaerobaculum tunisiense]
MVKLDQLEIRPLSTGELDQVLVIEAESFSNPWAVVTFIKELNNNYAHYLVAIFKEQVVGYLGSWLLCNEVHITTLAVREKYRRQGVATKLLEKLFTGLEQECYDKISLEVRASNHQAQKLYCEQGFMNVDTEPNYYSDNGEDAVVMWKQL